MMRKLEPGKSDLDSELSETLKKQLNSGLDDRAQFRESTLALCRPMTLIG